MRAPEPRASQAGLGIAGRFAIVSPARIGLVVVLLGSFASVGQASPSSGQGPVGGPVSFVIETITVEGVGGSSAKIVVSETLLVPGGAYTEAQLREALHRVERLPFVVEGDFSLRRGSERGRFELVITVRQTWPVYFGGTLSLARDDGPFGHPDDERPCCPTSAGRVFFGGYHEVSATVRSARFIDPRWRGRRPLALDAAYRHHNLFGRHVVGSAFFLRGRAVSRRRGRVGPRLAWPLSRVERVKPRLRRRAGREWKACVGTLRVVEDPNRRRAGRALLGRDTTDDPFAPGREPDSEAKPLVLEERGRTTSRNYDPGSPAVRPGHSRDPAAV